MTFRRPVKQLISPGDLFRTGAEFKNDGKIWQITGNNYNSFGEDNKIFDTPEAIQSFLNDNIHYYIRDINDPNSKGDNFVAHRDISNWHKIIMPKGLRFGGKRKTRKLKKSKRKHTRKSKKTNKKRRSTRRR